MSFRMTDQHPEEDALELPGFGRPGRDKSLKPDQLGRLAERAATSEPKAVLIREFGISRETVYQYLRTPASPEDRGRPEGNLRHHEHAAAP